MHELGHALGLIHPNFFGEYDLDYNQSFTAMSYYALDVNYYPTTPMYYDVRAIQEMYGVNSSYHDTNTTYDVVYSSPKLFTIWDADGVDTIIASSSSSNNIIDLRNINEAIAVNNEQFPTKLEHGSEIGNTKFWIAYGAHIENVVGGSGNDVINGSDAFAAITVGAAAYAASDGNNVLDGNGGNDKIYGNGGNDTLLGGSGDDDLFGDDGTGGGSGNDSLLGEGGDDALFGDGGNDTLDGGTGFNVLFGDAGDDVYKVSLSGASETVIDDSNGTLIVGGITVSGTTAYALGDADGIEYAWEFNGNTYAALFDAEGDLVIALDSDSYLLFAGFDNGDYGITLDVGADTLAKEDVVISDTVYGDPDYYVYFSPTSGDGYYAYESDVAGLSGTSFIQGAYVRAETIVGGSGNDTINYQYVSQNAASVVQLGAGNDISISHNGYGLWNLDLYAGDGRDFITTYGSQGNAYGEDGDDAIIAALCAQNASTVSAQATGFCA